MIPQKMNKAEKRAAWSLASVMSLRLLGLFMVLPLFSLYAHQLRGATPFLIGASLGVYGLTQGLLQIPFGMISDHIGRRKVIAFGLLIFIVGSIITALSHTITGVIIGRALQGAGAVGSTIMAMIADLTRPEQRTKAMAIAGMTIGMSFTLSIMLGPLLANWFSMSGMFWLAAGFGLLGILVLFTVVPSYQPEERNSCHPEERSDEGSPSRREILRCARDDKLFSPTLSHLYLSIFFLHAIFTATFVVVPISLDKLAGLPGHEQWYLYLPLMLLAFMISIPMIMTAEKNHKLKSYFLIAIGLMGVAQLFWWLFAKNLFISSVSLLLFLTAFTLLEAFLPSLISKSAPPSRKGTALGIFSSSQFLGIFAGGTLGGWLYGQWSLHAVYFLCVLIVLIWGTMMLKLNSGDLKYGERR